MLTVDSFAPAKKTFRSPSTPVSTSRLPMQSGLVILASPLRDAGDVRAVTSDVYSALARGYDVDVPLAVVVAIDDRSESPELYMDLCLWVAGLELPKGIHVYVTGTDERVGEGGASAAGMAFMERLVEMGVWSEVPDLWLTASVCRTTSEAPWTWQKVA